MTNSATGTNALTKSDSKSNFPINFQPMPKRFMVWDKEEHDFVPYDSNSCLARDEDNELYLCDIDWPAKDLVEAGSNRFILIQSTGLFDKNGKEIFEGSIVINDYLSYPDHRKGKIIQPVPDVVIYDAKIARFVFNTNPDMDLASRGGNVGRNLTVIGHILSNPELLEEKNV